MGFDIYITDFIFDEHGQYVGCERNDTLYFSYNWSDLKHIWYIQNDMVNLLGSEVEKTLKRALTTLDTMDVQAKKFDSQINKDWAWGVGLSSEDRLSVFRYHLEYFLEKSQEYSDCYFLGEETESLTINGQECKV